MPASPAATAMQTKAAAKAKADKDMRQMFSIMECCTTVVGEAVARQVANILGTDSNTGGLAL